MTRAELWQRFQRPLNDLQLWKALAQRLLDITTSLPDLPSIHTFLPQIEVIRLCGAGEAAGLLCDISATPPGAKCTLGFSRFPGQLSTKYTGRVIAHSQRHKSSSVLGQRQSLACLSWIFYMEFCPLWGPHHG